MNLDNEKNLGGGGLLLFKTWPKGENCYFLGFKGVKKDQILKD